MDVKRKTRMRNSRTEVIICFQCIVFFLISFVLDSLISLLRTLAAPIPCASCAYTHAETCVAAHSLPRLEITDNQGKTSRLLECSHLLSNMCNSKTTSKRYKLHQVCPPPRHLADSKREERQRQRL